MNGYTRSNIPPNPTKGSGIAAFGVAALVVGITMGAVHGAAQSVVRGSNPVTVCQDAAHRVQARTARELDLAAQGPDGVSGENYAAVRDAAESLLIASITYCNSEPSYRFDVDGAPPAQVQP